MNFPGHFSFRPIIALCFLLGLCITASADDAPAWLRQSASASVPTYEKDVPGVVLFDERTMSVSSDGKLVTTENYAIKILTREGRTLAKARNYYLVSSGKIRDISGWVIRGDGTTKLYDKKSVVDIIADQDDIYNEGRLKVIDASGDVDVGYVFGYTVVSEEVPLFYQDTWAFQERLPTLVSRYSLNLPAGWTASSITFNSPEVTPQVSGSNYTWEMRNLAPLPPEPMSPSTSNLSPRLVINYTPDAKTQSGNHVFNDWVDVSRWATAMHDPQVQVDDAVAAKARDLTVNATSELEKIRAIGTFVQNLQYISIDIGVGYGNGYRPRSSSLVLSRGYGDCKDKANLMRALLRALKIEAYPIAIYSGDPTFVRAQWPSPVQFNHCIIAIKVSDATNSPTVIKHDKLGRLLIFDATDPYTPVGDLPDYLQGSLAVIIAGDNGGLATMPLALPEADLLERNIEATISSTGEIKGKIHERAKGQSSAIFRREVRELSAPNYRKALESWLTRGATGARLGEVLTKDRADEMGFDLDVDFTGPLYGQVMQEKLLVFKPVFVGRRNGTSLTEAKRTNPVEIDSSAMKETAVFTLPEGFIVDEMPDAVNIETPFGKYSTHYEVKAGKLIFMRSMTMIRTIVPADKYDTVRAFYIKIRDAEQTPVVLIKK